MKALIAELLLLHTIEFMKYQNTRLVVMVTNLKMSISKHAKTNRCCCWKSTSNRVSSCRLDSCLPATPCSACYWCSNSLMMLQCSELLVSITTVILFLHCTSVHIMSETQISTKKNEKTSSIF